jgi:hypothetical protein
LRQHSRTKHVQRNRNAGGNDGCNDDDAHEPFACRSPLAAARKGHAHEIDRLGEGSAGGSCSDSQAATAEMSVSDSRVAMRFMQSGTAACLSPTRQRVICATMYVERSPTSPECPAPCQTSFFP